MVLLLHPQSGVYSEPKAEQDPTALFKRLYLILNFITVNDLGSLPQ
jgi:hypothetical protein